MKKPNWTANEDRILMFRYPELGRACAAYLPGRTHEAVNNRAKQLGVRFKAPYESPQKRQRIAELRGLLETFERTEPGSIYSQYARERLWELGA